MARPVLSKFIPPPKGLDLRTPWVSGVPETALTLDNLRPSPQGLQSLASGKMAHAGTVKRILGSHQGGFIYCALTGGIRNDWTGAGAVAYAFGSNPPANGGCFHYFSTAATGYTIYSDGSNVPGILDHTAAVWGAATWTGVGLANVFQTVTYRGRLYLAEENTSRFFYLPSGAITGAATAYNYGSLLQRSGATVCMGVISRDGGTGPDDFLCVYTSNGDLIVFSGNDPSATDWRVVGVYPIASPGGFNSNNQTCSRLFARVGGDLLVITRSGIFSVNELISGVDVSRARSLSAPIDEAMANLVLRASRPFWMQVLPSIRLLVVGDSTKAVWAMDMDTQGWFALSDSLGTNPYTCFHYFEPPLNGSGAGDVYGVNGTDFDVYQLFHKTDDVFGTFLYTPPWQLRTAYGRFGSVEDFGVSSIRPHVALIGLTAMAGATSYPLTLGTAYDLDHNYLTDTFSNWHAAARLGYGWEAVSTLGRKTHGWKGMRNQVGPSASIYMSGPAGSSSNLVSHANILGWDVRYQTVEQLGP